MAADPLEDELERQRRLQEEAAQRRRLLTDAPPVQATDPNFEERTAVRDIFNQPVPDELDVFGLNEEEVLPENQEFPANVLPGFTPPPPPQDLTGVSRELERFNAENAPLQPEIDVATLPDEAFEPALQPGRVVQNIGAPPVVEPFVDEGFFAGTRQAQRDVERRLDERIAAAEALEGTPAEVAGAQARLGVNTVADQLASITGAVTGDILSPVAEFGAGFFGGLDGPPQALAAGDDPTGAVDALSGEQGELSIGDTAEREAQEDAVRDTGEVAENVPPVSPNLVSDQPGVESFPLVGPGRGPGTEIIRGVRRTFQPDAPGTGEIPLGETRIAQLRNIGLDPEAAVDADIAYTEADAALINAGANALVAQTNASLQVDIPRADGTTVRGLMVIDPSAPGGVRIVPTDILVPLSDQIIVGTEEVATTGPTGETIALDKPIFFEPVQTSTGTQMRQVPFDGSAIDGQLIAQNPIGFAEAYRQAGEDGHIGAQRMAVALELLREGLARVGQ
jgi:hypothetical protein